MANKAFPILYLNLGGEMMYILDQRLIAQKLNDRCNKVMNDIARTMFNKRFIMELFLKPQPIFSQKLLREMFDRLAHASIMKLSTDSMDKLYDLMVMAVKYQILMSKNPRHLLMITLNHVDAIMDFTTNPAVRASIQQTYELLIQTYCAMPIGQLQHVRHSILNFFQDLKIKVSLFLQDGSQRWDGSFCNKPVATLYKGIDKPGCITIFDQKGEAIVVSKFKTGLEYEEARYDGGLGIHETGNRGTKFGLNMYGVVKTQSDGEQDSKAKTVALVHSSSLQSNAGTMNKCSLSMSDKDPSDANYGEFVEDPLMYSSRDKMTSRPGFRVSAKEELDLLAKLVTGSCHDNVQADYPTHQEAGPERAANLRINLFDTAGIDVICDDSRAENKGNEMRSLKAPLELENKEEVFDMKLSHSQRSGSDIDKIITEMNKIAAYSTQNDDEAKEDLLRLLDES